MIQLQPINRGREMQVWAFISMAFGSGGIVPRSESTCRMSVTVPAAMQGRMCHTRRLFLTDGGIAAPGDSTSRAFEVKRKKKSQTFSQCKKKASWNLKLFSPGGAERQCPGRRS